METGKESEHMAGNKMSIEDDLRLKELQNQYHVYVDTYVLHKSRGKGRILGFSSNGPGEYQVEIWFTAKKASYQSKFPYAFDVGTLTLYTGEKPSNKAVQVKTEKKPVQSGPAKKPSQLEPIKKPVSPEAPGDSSQPERQKEWAQPLTEKKTEPSETDIIYVANVTLLALQNKYKIKEGKRVFHTKLLKGGTIKNFETIIDARNSVSYRIYIHMDDTEENKAVKFIFPLIFENGLVRRERAADVRLREKGSNALKEVGEEKTDKTNQTDSVTHKDISDVKLNDPIFIENCGWGYVREFANQMYHSITDQKGLIIQMESSHIFLTKDSWEKRCLKDEIKTAQDVENETNKSLERAKLIAAELGYGTKGSAGGIHLTRHEELLKAVNDQCAFSTNYIEFLNDDEIELLLSGNTVKKEIPSGELEGKVSLEIASKIVNSHDNTVYSGGIVHLSGQSSTLPDGCREVRYLNVSFHNKKQLEAPDLIRLFSNLTNSGLTSLNDLSKTKILSLLNQGKVISKKVLYIWNGIGITVSSIDSSYSPRYALEAIIGQASTKFLSWVNNENLWNLIQGEEIHYGGNIYSINNGILYRRSKYLPQIPAEAVTFIRPSDIKSKDTYLTQESLSKKLRKKEITPEVSLFEGAQGMDDHLADQIISLDSLSMDTENNEANDLLEYFDSVSLLKILRGLCSINPNYLESFTRNDLIQLIIKRSVTVDGKLFRRRNSRLYWEYQKQ